MLANKLMSALSGGAEDKLYVDDVFSTYLYTGNGSTQTINNGIDLAGKGGMVWIKDRTTAEDHAIYDTTRGQGAALRLGGNSTAAQTNGATGLTAFSGSGFTLGGGGRENTLNDKVVSWTFRKAPKFFDVVTYTGNGASGRDIAHSLEIKPGLVIIKRTDGSSNWVVGATNSSYMLHLNSSAASPQLASGTAEIHTSTATTFHIDGGNAIGGAGGGDVNVSGATYVAYLFAHDPSADGIVQCGSYTGDGAFDGSLSATLGWEPQFVMIKCASGAGSWLIQDSARGLTATVAAAGNNELAANTSAAETAALRVNLKATGFRVVNNSSEINASGSTYIYLAIRRPNKPPTLGTQVYNAIARTGTGAAATVTGVGFAPDMLWGADRTGANSGGNCRTFIFDRLRGASQQLSSFTSSAEMTNTAGYDLKSFDMYGISLGSASNSYINTSDPISNHFFKRAPGVFDVVCFNGGPTSATSIIAHGIGAIPELVIVKQRSQSSDWFVYHTQSNTGAYLNYNFAFAAFAGAFPTAPTSSNIYLGSGVHSASSTVKLVAYLFATLPGISKVGSYIGNGTTQTIDCGFTTGARFILIKRADSTGDWYIWDTVRGIVSANDPHLSLNTTAAEVTTDDSVDPDASGFIVNQNVATNINVSGASYIFLSIA